MKKKLLTLGALAIIVSVSAQQVVPTTFVANNAKVYVKQKALVYNGGGLKTSGTESLLENEGNIMLVGGANDKIETVEPHAEGRNIVLKLNNINAPYNNYGQLYVQGFNQDKITAVVRKEYKSNKHGAYQQMAVPFHGKKLDFKHNNTNELGKDISEVRWTNDEVLSWDNRKVRFDNMPLTATSTSKGTNNRKASYENKATSYYIVGATGTGEKGSGVLFDASAKVYNVHGTPYTSGHKEILKDAGKDIDFGENEDKATWDYEKGGKNKNYYRERYNTYLIDAWEKPWKVGSGENEGYGKNMYHFGNPYLMNLDLSVFAYATKANENVIENLHGIRLEFMTDNNVWKSDNGGADTRHRESPNTPGYIGFTKRNDGYYTMVGDVDNTIVKPMGSFVIKLKDNSATSTQELNFDKLRTFAYTGRYAEDMPENSLRPLSKSSNSLAGRSTFRKATMGADTVKQLGVFALDKDGNVLDRTYYVVANDFTTGFSDEKKTQVYADADVNLIGTFEESVEGGIDNEHTNSFLYINEANETEFKGKAIPLALYDDRIVALKFEVRENALVVGDNGKTKSGESFYIGAYGNVNDAKAIAQKQEIPTNGATFFSLYFGKPVNSTLSVDAVPNKPSSTLLVKDSVDGKYKLFFDKDWKKAEVSVYDASGKLVKTYNEVNAQSSLEVELPSVNGVYVVKAISEKGETYIQKVKK